VRILVTGASGFAGRHLCQYLASIGDTVIACPGPDGPGSLDVTDASAVAHRIGDSQPEAIVHLAGVSSVASSHNEPARTFAVNALGTVNLLQAVRASSPTSRLLLIGSGEMYGRVAEGRLAEENDSLKPLSPYASSKCTAELVARQFAASYGLEVVCARPFNHVGLGQAPQFVVPSFARQLAAAKRGDGPAVIRVGDLSPVRDFLHVEDIVRGYRILLQPTTPLGTYNICSGVGRSIRSILDELIEISSVRAKIMVAADRLRTAEIPRLVGDPTRLLALGWKPRRTLHDALSDVFGEALRQ